MELLLINKDDFAPYRNLSVKVDNSQLEPFIIEAQRIDLYKYLGGDLYNRLLSVLTGYTANKEGNQAYVPTESEATYLHLLNGRTYTINGYTKYYVGLKPALVYLTYSRYVRQAHIFSTQSGFKINNNQYSEHVSQKDINFIATCAENDAQTYIRFALDYVKEFGSLYESEAANCCEIKTNNDPRRLKLGAIRRNKYKDTGCCNRLGTVSQITQVVAHSEAPGMLGIIVNDQNNTAQVIL